MVDDLGADESDDPPADVRDAEAIARRALALFAVMALGLGAPKDDITTWLRDEGLWSELTPRELQFVTAAQPSQQQKVNAGWRSEALVVLLWALRKVPELPALDVQCDTAMLQRILPPYADVTVADFIAGAARRSDHELQAHAESLLHAHWRARDARAHGKPVPAGLDIEIIQERHLAANWVIGYCGDEWDDVATDT